jgi:hypothetical protein
MRKLFYMGLESYESRYTLQLTEWNRRVFERRGLDVVYVPGQPIDNSQSISVGQVLDAHGRSYFAMSQMMNLVQMMRNGQCTGQDIVYFEDMFQPGIESLPYIMDQIPASLRPRVFVRCLAQSIDPDDFVHVWGMNRWMSLYEHMCNEFVTGVLATSEEMVAHMRIAGWRAPIYNVSGLAFGKQEVIERVGGAQNITPFAERPYRVGFAAWTSSKCGMPRDHFLCCFLFSKVGRCEATITNTWNEHVAWSNRVSSRSTKTSTKTSTTLC